MQSLSGIGVSAAAVTDDDDEDGVPMPEHHDGDSDVSAPVVHPAPRAVEMSHRDIADDDVTEDVTRADDAETVDPAALHEAVRMAEAILFAAAEPVPASVLAERLPADIDLDAVMERLSEDYAGRGVALVQVDDAWRFRTADDLAYLLQAEQVEQRKLSRAALETLAIIAYHQPATRAEIEDVRGVSLSKGVLDVLLELGWIRIRGRRRTPGRPLTFGTTDKFLDHFGLGSLRDLPGKDDLKGAGLLDPALPLDFSVPPTDDHPDLRPEEDPLEHDDPELSLHPRIEDDGDDDGDEVVEASGDDPDTGDGSPNQAPIPEATGRTIRSLQDETALDRIRDQVLRRD